VKRAGLLFLIAVQVFLVYTVRVREQLTCAAKGAARLTCRRIQVRLIRSQDRSFDIPDAASVTFHVSGQTTASHVSVNTSSIDAIDDTGQRVILLSVPAPETADAAAVERRLRDLPHATPPTFSFARDESKHAWLMLGICAAWWLAYIASSRLRPGRLQPTG
jgi:hypothetical protein